MEPALNALFDNHGSFIERLPRERYYNHADFISCIKKHEDEPLFEISIAGSSIEGREIKLIKTGKGSRRVFMWAQMHGDEPTANSALLDLLNFLRNPREFKNLRDTILDGVTLWIMPLVNPDGAERFTRENARKTDLNRDALDLSSPESRLLMSTFKKIKPHFAFNLHDQGRSHAVGETGRPAAISFLAPPPDERRTITPNRLKAMKLISGLVEVLEEVIPGHTGRYSDEFEPRAFGDTFQAMGAATILIESGGWMSDYNRSFQRELNFLLFVAGLNSIARGDYKKQSTEKYDTLPENRKLLYDTLLTGGTLEGNKRNIGINLIEKMSYPGRETWFEGLIKAVGDLRGRAGYHEFSVNGYEVLPGRTLSPDDKLYPGGNRLLSELELFRLIDRENFYHYVSEGYTNIKVTGEGSHRRFTSLPLNIVSERGTKHSSRPVAAGQPANILFLKEGKVACAVINGFYINLISKHSFPANALHLR